MTTGSTPVPAAWWNNTLVGADLETTGVDPFTARVVTASFLVCTPEGERTTITFLLDPEIDIPEGASAIHGYTTEYVREHGTNYLAGIIAIRDLINGWTRKAPLVAYNAAYDFTVIDSECRRLGIEPPKLNVVIDPFVMDKVTNRYRTGGRTLGKVAAAYGITLDNAHDATADASAAVDLARAMLNETPTVLTPDQFHQALRNWHQRQADGWLDYQRTTRGNANATCLFGWPVYLPHTATRERIPA